MSRYTLTARPASALLLCLSVVVVLLLIACQRPTSESSESAESSGSGDGIALAWEAWVLVNDIYVKADSLDSQRVAGAMISGMLESDGIPAYPFLTELATVDGRPPKDVPEGLADVWRTWSLLKQRQPETPARPWADAAVDGLLDALGERFAVRINPEAYARIQEEREQHYEGIGAFVAIRDGRIVQTPMRNSPAEQAGMRAGDVILEVDGVTVEGKSLQEVVGMVRGTAGSEVVLLIDRDGSNAPFELTVRRGEVVIDSVERQLLPGAIGHIRIGDFRDGTSDEVLNVLDELLLIEMLALILDLRGNQGESLESAQRVVSQFLTEGPFLVEVGPQGERTEWDVLEGGLAKEIEGIPMVVLVNGLTGSAAEAVAGALQDAERATLVGAKTLGKGSSSVFTEMSDGSALYLPVSHYYAPSGTLIQGNGITPDIEISADEGRLQGIDSQLAQAYDFLDTLLAELVPFR